MEACGQPFETVHSVATERGHAFPVAYTVAIGPGLPGPGRGVSAAAACCEHRRILGWDSLARTDHPVGSRLMKSGKLLRTSALRAVPKQRL